MSGREVKVVDRTAWVAEDGDGPPLVYLHGFSDIHAATVGWMPFHRALQERHTVIAPAHPGCAQTDDDDAMETIDDVVFHYAELFDALELDRFRLAGSCVGGWIAAEFAVRYPERVERLALLGATGLFVKDAPIGDIFWYAQPDDGVAYNGLRRLFFADAETAVGKELFPDGRAELEHELSRYKMYRFSSLIGFRPPYLYNRRLRERLQRYQGPALMVWGEADNMVPRSHAKAYAEGFKDGRVEIVASAGHSVAAEAPEETARLVGDFMAP